MFVDFVLQIVLGVVLTARVLRRDMRRLSAEGFARSWNSASFWSAVVVFGPLCIPVHFVRTRRSVRGFLVGLGWAAGVIFALGLVSEGLARLSEGKW